MKRKSIFFPFIFLMFAFWGRATAQSTISVYPSSLFRKITRISYEYHRPDTWISYGTFVSGYFGATYNAYTGFDVAPYVKLFTNRKKAPDAWYFQPKLIFGYLKAQEAYCVPNSSAYHLKRDINFTMYGGGLVFGRQWVFKKGFTLSVDFGAKYVYRNVPDTFIENGKEYVLDQSFMPPVPYWYWGPGCYVDGHLGIGYTFFKKRTN